MPIPEVKASPAAPPAPRKPERKPDPCVVVIFGASGDLTKRKLLPALYHLQQHGLLPDEIAVVGVARRSLEKTFAADMGEGIVSGGGVEENEPALAPFLAKVSYFAMNFDDDAGYTSLKQMLAEIDRKIAGQQIVASEHHEQAAGSNVIDLMEALRASLQGKPAKVAKPAPVVKTAAVPELPDTKERKPIRRVAKVQETVTPIRARAKK